MTKKVARERYGKQDPANQDLVNRMTNYQRNQWARVGYPTKREAIAVILHIKKPQR